jgi:hypothetical protein
MSYADVKKKSNYFNMGEAPVPQSKYYPFSLEEFQCIKQDLAGITHTLPTHLAGIFWSRCNTLRGTDTAQPCTCASSARHWGECVGELQKYVKQKDGQE